MELKGSYRMPRRGIPNEFLNRADAMECEAAASFPEPPFPSIASFHPDPFSSLPSSTFLEGTVFGKSLTRLMAISCFTDYLILRV